MVFKLPELAYALDAFEPYMSARTLGVHYGKHHQGYIDALNKAVAGTDFENQTLKQIILGTWLNPVQKTLFNNAAQAWNHSFFWNSLTPQGGGVPPEQLANAMNTSFGSLEACKAKFEEAALSQFGSGWVWLVEDVGQLSIVTTSNADNPLRKMQRLLLVCDVWEHAYYLDYENNRAGFVKAFLDHLVNWDFAVANLKMPATEKPSDKE